MAVVNQGELERRLATSTGSNDAQAGSVGRTCSLRIRTLAPAYLRYSCEGVDMIIGQAKGGGRASVRLVKRKHG